MVLKRSNEYFTRYTFPRDELNPFLDSLREGGFEIKPLGADYGVYDGAERVSIINYMNGRVMQMGVEVMSSLDKFLLRRLKD